MAGVDEDPDFDPLGVDEGKQGEDDPLIPRSGRDYEKEGARPKERGRKHESLGEGDIEDEGDKSVLYPPGEDGLLFYETTNKDEKLEVKETKIEQAWGKIREKYNCEPRGAPFVATMKDGKVEVALLKGKKLVPKFHRLFKENGELRIGVPKTIVEYLGKKNEDISLVNFNKIQSNQEEIKKRLGKKILFCWENQTKIRQRVKEE